MAKAVVLDVDGTLMDTNYLHTEAWARAFEKVGHRVPRVKLHREIGKGAELLIRKFVDDEEKGEEINSFAPGSGWPYSCSPS
jgi:beta-phosphoglucomutase-like phosphatase (HAD superfamily)